MGKRLLRVLLSTTGLCFAAVAPLSAAGVDIGIEGGSAAVLHLASGPEDEGGAPNGTGQAPIAAPAPTKTPTKTPTTGQGTATPSPGPAPLTAPTPAGAKDTAPQAAPQAAPGKTANKPS
jgi:hypothetical protein